jgi:uncharacterized RDD family membrane protein YckC
MTMTTTTNPYAPPKAAVRDVRDPLAATEPAGRGARLGAALLDGLVMGLMMYAPIVPLVYAGQNSSTGWAAGFGLLALAGFIAWLWLTILFVKRNGQTIGKKAVGIKVVRSDGSPASLGRIFWLRNFVNGALGLIPLYALVDHLLIFGEARQCIHDKLADTIVVTA